MTDAVVHRLEVSIREATCQRHDVDPPDVDAYRSLMAQLAAVRAAIQREDALRLETLIERRTGVRP